MNAHRDLLGLPAAAGTTVVSTAVANPSTAVPNQEEQARTEVAQARQQAAARQARLAPVAQVVTSLVARVARRSTFNGPSKNSVKQAVCLQMTRARWPTW